MIWFADGCPWLCRGVNGFSDAACFTVCVQRRFIKTIRLCGPRYWEYTLLCGPSTDETAAAAAASSAGSGSIVHVSPSLLQSDGSGSGCVVLWARRKRAHLPYLQDPQGKCTLLAGTLPMSQPPHCMAKLYRLKTPWTGDEDTDDDDDDDGGSGDGSGSDDRDGDGDAGGGDSDGADAAANDGQDDQEQLTRYAQDPSVVLLMSVLASRSGGDAPSSPPSTAFAVDPAVLYQFVAEVRAADWGVNHLACTPGAAGRLCLAVLHASRHGVCEFAVRVRRRCACKPSLCL